LNENLSTITSPKKLGVIHYATFFESPTYTQIPQSNRRVIILLLLKKNNQENIPQDNLE
jgi:hypothetical protein